jgi:hypothetical protein
MDDLDPLEPLEHLDSAFPSVPRFLPSLARAVRCPAPSRPSPALEHLPQKLPQAAVTFPQNECEQIGSDCDTSELACSNSEPISEGGTCDAEEEIDSSNLSQFFSQKRAVFEFLENDDAIQLWDCGYSRVLIVAIVQSDIEGLNNDIYRLIVRADQVSSLRDRGDRFVMGEPFYAFQHNEQHYLLAPNVSGKCC